MVAGDAEVSLQLYMLAMLGFSTLKETLVLEFVITFVFVRWLIIAQQQQVYINPPSIFQKWEDGIHHFKILGMG